MHLNYLGLLAILLLSSCAVQRERINGVSFVAHPEPVVAQNIKPVKEVNANYAAIMPFGFIRNTSDPQIHFNTERQWFGETAAGVAQYASELQKEGIKIMLKPQIWIWRGEYTGTLEMTTEADWLAFEESYSTFILSFAKQAEDLNIPMLCIGTELDKFVQARPAYWDKLITEIRAIYNGQLTYAANWDEYKRVPFWEQLDYIGVDAYFPISTQQTPQLAKAIAAWQPWLDQLELVSTKADRPVLFTEYGYRSWDHAGKEPWQSIRTDEGVNLEAQQVLLQALYDAVWDQEWFAGGFIWKWFVNHDYSGGTDNTMFTPQNKPAEMLIKEHYGTYKED